jgi:hypothetical protein
VVTVIPVDDVMLVVELVLVLVVVTSHSASSASRQPSADRLQHRRYFGSI